MDPTSADRARAKERGFVPPPVNGDFYRIADQLDSKERAVVKRVRDFMEAEVAPIIEDYWGRDQFPHELIPKLAALDVHIAGVGYQGYGAAGGSWLLSGLIAMELARVDSSIATFWGVHTGLSAGSIYLCGDECVQRAKLGDALGNRGVAPHIYESEEEAKGVLKERSLRT
jgi:glutaryl-CoA dehydrogenase